ncbi:hypothetical protein HNQ60_001761 [Povalibacter uvarum]|uniref:Copper chaperone PCu(A)C n=1 Tax=Povalibacter uvarum TaxID=732238 RepID=A0A841HJI5_9GAMM|nr:copper chaperone PCu(A)C [Povalibacter uvarum]MBB6092883.1 hypothetical protein [Povalibacter uvarum]
MRKWLAGFAMLALVACTQSPQSGIEVKDAWSPAAPPGAAAIAVYAKIVVHKDDTLLKVSSSRAAVAEVHNTFEEGGMMRMRPVGQLDLKRGEAISLQPGGMHLMLMGVSEPLAPGAALDVTFHFANAGDVTATAEVTAPGEPAH